MNFLFHFNSFTQIFLTILLVRIVEEPRNPCNPSPCGTNAICREQNGVGSCSCITEYFGDPYVECRPECLMNSDCSRDKSCINNKCRNPCPGTCGINAECIVNNHIPTCNCLQQYTGDPLRACHPVPTSKIICFLLLSILCFTQRSVFSHCGRT